MILMSDIPVNFIYREGALVKCEAYGKIQVNSSLPGVPELTLSFSNPTIINDVRFHPCVRFRPWESNQILSFVPPDGQFELMSYRCINICSLIFPSVSLSVGYVWLVCFIFTHYLIMNDQS